MPSLGEVQSGVRLAMLSGDASAAAPLLFGGGDPRARLAIHSRHYQASLVQVLTDRFPATCWLIGSTFVSEAAREFVRVHPPARPCLAEYGDQFPGFLAERRGVTTIPYLRDFATLEWYVGEVAVDIDGPAASMGAFGAIDAEAWPDVVLTLQSGVRYVTAGWGVDDLMALYLTDSEPERFEVAPGDLRLEVRGARGDVRMNRLTPGTSAFRGALASGATLGDAAERAFECDDAFDLTEELATLIVSGLVVAITPPTDRSAR
jgi:hypothetical protein